MSPQTSPSGKTDVGNNNQKSSGCSGCLMIFLAIIAVMAGIVIFNKARDTIVEKKETAGKIYEPGKTDLKALLGDNIDDDTYIIEAHYPGIEEDIKNFRMPDGSVPSEDDLSYAEYVLEQDYAEREMEKALSGMAGKVCVIGAGGGGATGYANGASIGYDNGFFRSLPYSTFWMKSYEGGTGFLTDADDSEEDGTGVEFWSLYTFKYYPLSADEIESMKAAIDQEADAIASCIPADADLWVKARVIHDELVKRTEYDLAYSDHCHDLYGALVEHQTVCEGYALAFRHVMNRIGEYCDVVVSDWDQLSDTTHAWNRINGPTYEEYIDVTWDDSGYTGIDGNAIIKYDYFGLTEEEISAIDSHTFESSMKSFMNEPQPYNYYRHEGFMFSAFDPTAVENAFLKQYQNGSNYLTVRFENQEAYQNAVAWLSDSGNFWSVIGDIGYNDEMWLMTNDDLFIYSIALGKYPE